MQKAKPFLIAAVALVVLILGGTWVYINLIKEDAPKRLTIADAGSATSTTVDGAAPSTPTTAATLDGEWKLQSGSVVGYRVKEVLFGQKTEAVGRTEKVKGSLTVSGTSISTATFEADVASMKSDDSRRDASFSGRVMNTPSFPTATFTLTEPIVLDSLPTAGTTVGARAKGDLTLRGVAKPVEVAVTAKLDGDTVKVAGSFDVVFSNWQIPNPSMGPVTTEDHGQLEFALSFAR